MLDIGITKETTFILEGVFEGGILVNGFDLVAALVGAVLVAVLAVFFQYTRVGRALRAVADDHQAALSVGIPLKTIWVIVWSVAGDRQSTRLNSSHSCESRIASSVCK